MKRARSSEMSFANLSEELKRISNHDLQFHRQLLDPSFSSSHPSDIGIASALAVTAAVIKVMPKTVESVVSGSKPWYRKTSFRENASSSAVAAHPPMPHPLAMIPCQASPIATTASPPASGPLLSVAAAAVATHSPPTGLPWPPSRAQLA